MTGWKDESAGEIYALPLILCAPAHLFHGATLPPVRFVVDLSVKRAWLPAAAEGRGSKVARTVVGLAAFAMIASGGSERPGYPYYPPKLFAKKHRKDPATLWRTVAAVPSARQKGGEKRADP